MKWMMLALGLIIVSALFCQEYEIIGPENSNPITFEHFVDELAPYDVIFFGEYHDNEVLHKLEAELLKALYEKDPKLAVSMEMFERDVQGVLDRYLEASVTEDEFLENSRPWPNYASDYRPIIEFARENQLRVIAANVPRRLAAKISRGGVEALESFTDEDETYVASELHAPNDEYKKRFLETMTSGMGGEAHAMGKMNLENLYAAQCMKDDTMAESIAVFIQENPGMRIIHFNGDFHSRGRLGTVARLSTREPNLRIAVISPALEPFNEELSVRDQFFILLPESE